MIFKLTITIVIIAVSYCNAGSPVKECRDPKSAPVNLDVSQLLPCSSEDAPCKIENDGYYVTADITVQTPETQIGNLTGYIEISGHGFNSSKPATLEIMDKYFKNEYQPDNVPTDETVHIRSTAEFDEIDAFKDDVAFIKATLFTDGKPMWCIYTNGVITN